MHKLVERIAMTAGLALALSTACYGAPALIDDVNGYTLSGERLQHFTALAFEHGRVLATGDTAGLRQRFPTAHVIDGHGDTLVPGLIDAHGHVLDLGLDLVPADAGGRR